MCLVKARFAKATDDSPPPPRHAAVRAPASGGFSRVYPLRRVETRSCTPCLSPVSRHKTSPHAAIAGRQPQTESRGREVLRLNESIRGTQRLQGC